MNKALIVSVAAAVVMGAVLFFIYGQKEPVQQSSEVVGEPAVTIVRTNSGYEPKEVTIKKGDIVLWKNESDEYHWPASDLHPTHAIYSEFDPLKPLAPSTDWKFKFEQTGEWKFHDHIRANKVGTVTVVE